MTTLGQRSTEDRPVGLNFSAIAVHQFSYHYCDFTGTRLPARCDHQPRGLRAGNTHNLCISLLEGIVVNLNYFGDDLEEDDDDDNGDDIAAVMMILIKY